MSPLQRAVGAGWGQGGGGDEAAITLNTQTTICFRYASLSLQINLCHQSVWRRTSSPSSSFLISAFYSFCEQHPCNNISALIAVGIFRSVSAVGRRAVRSGCDGEAIELLSEQSMAEITLNHSRLNQPGRCRGASLSPLPHPPPNPPYSSAAS